MFEITATTAPYAKVPPDREPFCSELSLTQEEVDSISFRELALLLNDYEFVTKETAHAVVRKYVSCTLKEIASSESQNHFYNETAGDYAPGDELRTLTNIYGVLDAGRQFYSDAGHSDLLIKRGESKVFPQGLFDDSDSYEPFSQGALRITIEFIQRVKDLYARNEVMSYAEIFFAVTNVLASSLPSILESFMPKRAKLLSEMI